MFPLKKYFPVIIIIYLFKNINLEVTKFAGKIYNNFWNHCFWKSIPNDSKASLALKFSAVEKHDVTETCSVWLTWVLEKVNYVQYSWKHLCSGKKELIIWALALDIELIKNALYNLKMKPS